MFNVISSIEELPHISLRKAYQYWLDIKGDRLMPSRANLNPADIVDLLSCLTLVDVENDPRRYKMRLVGTETVKAMGQEITGKYLSEIYKGEFYLKDRYDWLVSEKRPYWYIGKLMWAQKSYVEYSVIGLPMSDDDENVNILMFVMHFKFPDKVRTKTLRP